MSTLHDRLGALRSGQDIAFVRLGVGTWRPSSGLQVEDVLHAVLGALTLGCSTLLVWAVVMAGFSA